MAKRSELRSTAAEYREAAKLLKEAGLFSDSTASGYRGMPKALRSFGFTPLGGFHVVASHHPNRLAIIDDLGQMTYNEVLEAVDNFASAMGDLRLPPKTRVGVLCRNHRYLIIALLAAQRMGRDVVLLNPFLSGVQLTKVVSENDIAALVSDDEFIPSLLSSGLSGTTQIIRAWQDKPQAPPTDSVSAIDELLRMKVLVDQGGTTELPDKPRRGRVIVLTSGTTGVPKGAVRPEPRSTSVIVALLSRLPFRANQRILISAPVFHTWGLSAWQFSSLTRSTVVLRRRFEPLDALQTAEKHRCEMIVGVPVMAQRMLNVSQDDVNSINLSKLDSVVLSGSAMPAPKVSAFLDKFGDKLYMVYGSTEASWVAMAQPDELKAKPDTAGRPPKGTHVLIVDAEDRELPRGETGRILVHNAMPFDGYTRPGAHVERFGEFVDTGDMGRHDPDGLVYVQGRSDDMIISGGENVYPHEVEDALCAMSQVREAAVVGVPDDEYGQRFAAFIQLLPGQSIDADAVREQVKERCASFAVPRDIHLVDELPRNPTGKVLKRQLFEMAEASVNTATSL